MAKYRADLVVIGPLRAMQSALHLGRRRTHPVMPHNSILRSAPPGLKAGLPCGQCLPRPALLHLAVIRRYRNAVVLGGAAYMFHWLKPAVAFSRRHRKELAARPVWLFSSGPLGTDLVDKDGKNVLEATRPKEFDELTGLREVILPA